MKNVDQFKTFLIQSGATVLDLTNEYEVVRFRTVNGVSVVYEGRRGRSYTGEAREAFEQFKSGNIWQILRRDHKEREKIKKLILDRDGPNCFFCGVETVAAVDRTMEHLLAISDGGNNNPNNLTIACEPCNKAVGSRSIVDKIKFRETKRGNKNGH